MYNHYCILISNISFLQRSLATQNGRVMDHLLPDGLRGTCIVNLRQSVVARSQPPLMHELETWKETVLPTLARYLPNDIYNGDETALFYRSLPHRTYCFDSDKPAGSAKCKDRLTLLIITNMDGSDHRKLSVIGKSKTPRCLQKKYKMQVIIIIIIIIYFYSTVYMLCTAIAMPLLFPRLNLSPWVSNPKSGQQGPIYNSSWITGIKGIAIIYF